MKREKFLKRHGIPLIKRYDAIDKDGKKKIHQIISMKPYSAWLEENKVDLNDDDAKQQAIKNFITYIEKYDTSKTESYGLYHFSDIVTIDIDDIIDKRTKESIFKDKKSDTFSKAKEIVQSDLFLGLDFFQDHVYISKSSSGKKIHILVRSKVISKTITIKGRLTDNFFDTEYFTYKMDFLSRRSIGALPQFLALHDETVAFYLNNDIPPCPKFFEEIWEGFMKNQSQEKQPKEPSSNKKEKISYDLTDIKEMIKTGFQIIRMRHETLHEIGRQNISQSLVWPIYSMIQDTKESEEILIENFKIFDDFDENIARAQTKTLLKSAKNINSGGMFHNYVEACVNKESKGLLDTFKESLLKDCVLSVLLDNTKINGKDPVFEEYLNNILEYIESADKLAHDIIQELRTLNPFGDFIKLYDVIHAYLDPSYQRRQTTALHMAFHCLGIAMQRAKGFSFPRWSMNWPIIFGSYVGPSSSGKDKIENFFTQVFQVLEEDGFLKTSDDPQSQLILREMRMSIRRSAVVFLFEGLNDARIRPLFSKEKDSNVSNPLFKDFLGAFNNNISSQYHSKASGEKKRIVGTYLSTILTGQLATLPIPDISSGFWPRFDWHCIVKPNLNDIIPIEFKNEKNPFDDVKIDCDKVYDSIIDQRVYLKEVVDILRRITSNDGAFYVNNLMGEYSPDRCHGKSINIQEAMTKNGIKQNKLTIFKAFEIWQKANLYKESVVEDDKGKTKIKKIKKEDFELEDELFLEGSGRFNFSATDYEDSFLKIIEPTYISKGKAANAGVFIQSIMSQEMTQHLTGHLSKVGHIATRFACIACFKDDTVIFSDTFYSKCLSFFEKEADAVFHIARLAHGADKETELHTSKEMIRDGYKNADIGSKIEFVRKMRPGYYAIRDIQQSKRFRKFKASGIREFLSDDCSDLVQMISPTRFYKN